MEMLLLRQDEDDFCTLGELRIDGVHEAFTLEDIERSIKVPGQTAIPQGRYEVVVTFSPHFQRALPLLLNVPQFTGVRIHAGNTAADTEGCILVGHSRAHDSVLDSRLTMADLQPKIAGALARHESVWITVTRSEP